MHPALVAALLCSAALSTAHARSLCVVVNPTGTPLNVRASPPGSIIGALYNGTRVVNFTEVVDAHGRVWSHVATVDSGKDGWVYRSFLDCQH